MAWSLNKLNFLRLSGVSSLLGIDLGPNRARIVELRVQGGIVNKFRSRFRGAKYFTIYFEAGMDQKQKADLIKNALIKNGIKTRYASSSVQGSGVRTLMADIPRSAMDVAGWIADHAEKLLRIPVQVKDLAFGYETMAESEEALQSEVTFVRKEEIKETEALFSEAGLTLLSLTAGVRDVLSPLLYDEEFLSSNTYSFAYLDTEEATVFEYKDRKRVRVSKVEMSECDLSFASSLRVAGETEGISAKRVEPFFVPSQYMLALGCALKGWIEELHPLNFHSEEYGKKKEEFLSKALFLRVLVSAGLFLFLLLGGETLFGTLIDHYYEKCEATLLASGVNFTELKALENDTAALKEEVEKSGSLAYRSDCARALHEVARLTPEGVWLTKIRIDAKESKNVKMTVNGGAHASDNISSFLQALERSEIFKDVHLIKSGMQDASDISSTPEGNNQAHSLTFELVVHRR